MVRVVARLTLVVVLALTSVLIPTSARLLGATDACPEPNDEFQQACSPGPGAELIGTIDRPDDVDAFRIEVLDFDATVRLELKEAPAPYRFVMGDWAGRQIATSNDSSGFEALETKLRIPGSYYVFVQSTTGEYSETRPYRVTMSTVYASPNVPRVLYSRDFRDTSIPELPTVSDTGVNLREENGGYVLSLLGDAATHPDTARTSIFGPMLPDFTMTMDARVIGGDKPTVGFVFRSASAANYNVVTVDLPDYKICLLTLVEGHPQRTGRPCITDDSVEKLDVLRTTIRVMGDQVCVGINATHTRVYQENQYTAGRIGVGGVFTNALTTYRFDNILVTTPGSWLSRAGPGSGAPTLRSGLCGRP